MDEIIHKQECYAIIGRCFEVHNNLGAGFLEIVYKDALEYEFRINGIPLSGRKSILSITKEYIFLIDSMPILLCMIASSLK